MKARAGALLGLVAVAIWLVGTPAAAGDKDPAKAAAEQVERGAKLFGEHCSECHGKAGQGTDEAPPLVGKDALPLDPRPGQKVRKAQFRTAWDVAQFVVKNMPANEPGSLKLDEYVAILAFDLKANGVELRQELDQKVAAGITLHP